MFWDYENIRIPVAESQPGRVLNGLGALLGTLPGRVVWKWVYYDPTKHTEVRTPIAALEAQCFKPRAVDARLPQAVDNMIKLDMATKVFPLAGTGRGAEATVVLISGDRGFAPMLHELRDQQVRIIVVYRDQHTTSPDLLAAAAPEDRYMWNEVVAAGREGRSPHPTTSEASTGDGSASGEEEAKEGGTGGGDGAEEYRSPEWRRGGRRRGHGGNGSGSDPDTPTGWRRQSGHGTGFMRSRVQGWGQGRRAAFNAASGGAGEETFWKDGVKYVLVKTTSQDLITGNARIVCEAVPLAAVNSCYRASLEAKDHRNATAATPDPGITAQLDKTRRALLNLLMKNTHEEPSVPEFELFKAEKDAEVEDLHAQVAFLTKQVEDLQAAAEAKAMKAAMSNARAQTTAMCDRALEVVDLDLLRRQLKAANPKYNIKSSNVLSMFRRFVEHASLYQRAPLPLHSGCSFQGTVDQRPFSEFNQRVKAQLAATVARHGLARLWDGDKQTGRAFHWLDDAEIIDSVHVHPLTKGNWYFQWL